MTSSPPNVESDVHENQVAPKLAENLAPTGGRIIVHRRTERTFLTRLLQALVKPFRPRLARPSKIQPAESPQLSPCKAAKKKCHIVERKVNGLWTYDLTPKSRPQRTTDGKTGRKRRILYFSGGGWQSPPTDNHWKVISEFVCRLSDTKLTLISPPLAPKCPASVSIPQTEKTFRSLLAEATKDDEVVIVAGDSSGGNISLCLVMWTLLNGLEDGINPPVAIMAICPSTNLRHEDPKIKEAEKHDPILTHDYIMFTANAWAGPDRNAQPPNVSPANLDALAKWDWGYDDPRVSPIRADLTPLTRRGVKIHGVTASYDCLGPDAEAFRDKCDRNGVEGEWLSWEGQMHCFPLSFAYGFSESKEAMDWIIDILGKH